MIFDTHTHLDDEAFSQDLDSVVQNLKQSGISLILDPGCDLETSQKSVELSEKYDFIYSAVGFHPHEVSRMDEESYNSIKGLCKAEKVVAIGEIGLDYYYNYSPRNVQKKAFEKQISLAEEMKLPFIIHSRDASQDTYEILKSCKKDTPCVLHCFSQSIEMAKLYLNLGCFLSFAGPVTFKKSVNLQEVAKYAPIDRIFIETDSPYLTPEPKRGKRNEPANVKYVGQKIAQLRGVPENELFDVTYKNAVDFFNITL